VFITGILLFSLASLLGGLATSSGWLLAARALNPPGWTPSRIAPGSWSLDAHAAPAAWRPSLR
jgi:hypothetical protein